MEYEFFRPVIIHMTTVRNFSYGFVKRCFITSIKYFEQLILVRTYLAKMNLFCENYLTYRTRDPKH